MSPICSGTALITSCSAVQGPTRHQNSISLEQYFSHQQSNLLFIFFWYWHLLVYPVLPRIPGNPLTIIHDSFYYSSSNIRCCTFSRRLVFLVGVVFSADVSSFYYYTSLAFIVSSCIDGARKWHCCEWNQSFWSSNSELPAQLHV